MVVVVAAVVPVMAMAAVVVVALAMVKVSLRLIPCYQEPSFSRLLKRRDEWTDPCREKMVGLLPNIPVASGCVK